MKTFRKKVETKSEGKKQTKNTSVFRTASVCMMVAVLAVGVLYLNDYHKLKKTETVISKLDDKNSGKELVETKPVNGLVSENRKKDSQDAADGEAAGTDTEDCLLYTSQRQYRRTCPVCGVWKFSGENLHGQSGYHTHA